MKGLNFLPSISVNSDNRLCLPVFFEYGHLCSGFGPYNARMVPSMANTKLNRPLPRPNLVARPSLIARLNAGVNRKLTLVSAPAGFG